MQEVFEKIKAKIKGYAYIELGLTLSNIERAINEVAEEYNNGWIPVEERLPEKKMEVLICNEIGEMTSTWYIPWAENSKAFKRFAHRIGGYETVAWQPLPPKYQPKGDKE